MHPTIAGWIVILSVCSTRRSIYKGLSYNLTQAMYTPWMIHTDKNFKKQKHMARSFCVHVLGMQALFTPSRVFNINTQSTCRRALKPSQDKEDRWTCRYERERADSLFIMCSDLLTPLLFVWKLCMKSQAVCIRVYLLTWTMRALWCIQIKFWWQHRDKSSYICALGMQALLTCSRVLNMDTHMLSWRSTYHTDSSTHLLLV